MNPRPNILFITADQWRGDCLGLMGHPMVKTPTLDALAKEAVVFENHIAPCAPCSPARASLYTGLYQMNHRVVTNGTPLDARFDNIALAARRAGYRPTLFGYSDTTHDPRGRDPQDPDLQSYEEVLTGFELRQPLREDDRAWRAWLVGRGYPHALEDDPHAVAPAPDGGVSLSPPGYGAEETQTAFLVDRLLDWHAEQGPAPWFAHVSFLRPHPPFVVPEPYASMFAPEDAPTPIPIGQALSDFVEATRALTPAAAFQPGLTGSVADLRPEDFARIRAIYYGMIAEVDAQLGRLFASLKLRGGWDDTLVIFTSDHGEMLGDHGLLGKGGPFVESQHIPLIIKGTNGVAGREPGFTSAADVFPTLVDLWDVQTRHVPNGASLRPALVEGASVGRDWAIWEFDFRHALAVSHPGLQSRTPRKYHMTVLRRRDDQYVHSPALGAHAFDLHADPNCQVGKSDPALRLNLAEALLDRQSILRDETLERYTLPVA